MSGRGRCMGQCYYVTVYGENLGMCRIPAPTDVAVLSARLQPAPFAHVRRSRANQLRILARGGARSLLGWAVYNTHTRGGTTHACPLCQQPDSLAVMHLVPQCQGLQQLRARVWAKGVAFAVQRLSTGVASPLCEVMSTTPADGEGVLVWAVLTCPCGRHWLRGDHWGAPGVHGGLAAGGGRGGSCTHGGVR